MLTTEEQEVARQAKRIYSERLKSQLEATHMDAYVAIEPKSGEYFVGNSVGEADDAAREKFPDRLTYVLRIGHAVIFHIGAAK